MRFVKPERISLRKHPELNEKWVQDRIAEDPKILGLGDVILKERERRQRHAGRLDLLLQDPDDDDRRYEVELQLGPTDESHIIRTLEYWDIEKRRLPNVEHCAVIVAEEITTRFFNVINLFNSVIPIIAIQMSAFAMGDDVALVFTTVLNELERGGEEEEKQDAEEDSADRGYWEKRVGPEILGLADQCLAIVRQWEPSLNFDYKRSHIGLVKDGLPERFATFRPKGEWLRVEVRLERSDEVDKWLEVTGMDAMPYKSRKYRIRLTRADFARFNAEVSGLLKRGYDNRE